MKRVITINTKTFIIEGEYLRGRHYNYHVYDDRGKRAFEAGYISVKGEKKPLCVSIAFERLKDAKRWLTDGCPVRRGLSLIWAAHSNAADAAFKQAEGDK